MRVALPTRPRKDRGCSTAAEVESDGTWSEKLWVGWEALLIPLKGPFSNRYSCPRLALGSANIGYFDAQLLLRRHRRRVFRRVAANERMLFQIEDLTADRSAFVS